MGKGEKGGRGRRVEGKKGEWGIWRGGKKPQLDFTTSLSQNNEEGGSERINGKICVGKGRVCVCVCACVSVCVRVCVTVCVCV